MTEPWFNPNLYSWIPGTFLGCAGGIWGGLAGTLAWKGRAKRLILGLGLSLLIAEALLLVVGILALTLGQPWGIWYAFLEPGAVGVLLFSLGLPQVLKVYRKAEARRLDAQDL